MKKSLYFLSLLIMMICVAMPVSAKDGKNSETAVFTLTPGMSCQNCENKIKTNLRFEKGVSDIQTSLKNQTVTVTFNPKKTDVQKLTAAFKKIGYEATTGTPTQKKCDAKGNCCGGDSHKGCPEKDNK
ncbi:MAG: heavy-metal-associated domain-containing protein [Muribaculaceae bacterium]|nr:heavy-metal-associated domain-containing protein [Muribaculaceae bacterium]